MTGELTLRPFFWRATELFPEKKIVSRTHDGIQQYSYGDISERVSALASALSEIGVSQSDRVGTLGWNHHRHYEAYFGVPLMGAQIHTINVQLPDEHIEYIVNDAQDDVLLIDPSMVDTVERLWDRFESVETVIVMADSLPETEFEAYAYESLLDSHHNDGFDWPELEEDQPAGMCYTSGTTGLPKGVEYTHKMYYTHAMMAMTPAALNISEADVIMPVVPMFHVNAWEFPYAATMAGSKQVYSGPSPDPADLVRLIEKEGVTLTAGVPTVWINVLDYLDQNDGDLSSLERIIVGGSAAPEEMMRRYENEYDVVTDHAWGMTETMSIGSVSRPKSWMDDWEDEEVYTKRKKQGLLSPGVEMKVIDDEGQEVPWDGESFGELHVRGPTIAPEYYDRPDTNEEEYEDGWLKTGDIVSVDEDGYLEVVDRSKDVIKSGGEWISSIELENALIAHEEVLEAAVIAVNHEKWRERPFAFVVPREESNITAEDLRIFLEENYEFPKWWLPDGVRFINEVPKTATGKFDKKTLRDEQDEVELHWTPGKD